MSDFAEAVLQKIKESEATAVEKHNRLRQCGLQVDELKRRLEEYEMEVEKAKDRVVVARAALQSRKVDLAQYSICHDSMEHQSEVLSGQIAATTLARQDKLQEMTDLLDRISADTKQFTTSYGLVASEDAVSQRRRIVRSDLVKELEEVEKLYVEVNRMEAAVAEKKKIFAEVEQMRKELEETKELRRNLENEASELMGRVSSLSLRREEERTMSKTGREVRELQREVSRLMQEGRFAGGEQELLEGRFKLEAAEDKEEDHCGQEEEEREKLAGQFLTGERRGESGVGVRKQGARFSFDKM